jgi:SAM-dependent methyltransferase
MAANPATPDLVKALQEFVDWRKAHLSGDEKGEAQVYLDHLFQAFGNGGVHVAGATLEKRLKKNDQGGTAFADLVWKPRVLVEMKKAGSNLSKHYQQAFDYWVNLVPDRPQYVVLCNFDEFWIYDLNKQVHDPVDRLPLVDLPKRWEALSFLLPDAGTPVFQHDMVAVTREAASDVAHLFRAMLDRGIARDKAQRFVLQSVLTLFAEDVGLLPSHLYTTAIRDCLDGASPYLTLFGLFKEMDSPGVTGGGPYKGTPYFNGGLFATIEPFDLTKEELDLLHSAAITDWSKVRPAIFGTIFEDSLLKSDRHKYGQHFTDEADIMRIVGPTITRPWMAAINEAQTLKDLGRLENELIHFRVLDPACGSGNFLYLAYRDLRRVEKALHDKRALLSRSAKRKGQTTMEFVTVRQFFGIDIDPFAIEIAKMTLMLAKKLAAVDVNDERDVLPLDDLSANFWATDALDPAFRWPKFDVCIGNPPYLGRQKLQQERGASYLHTLDSWFPDVKGKADYVVYWFRLAHDQLPPGGRAGLVATNSVREGNSKIASLDYVVNNGGTIIEAVSSQKWTGTAQVDVSIVDWIKGRTNDPKVLVLPDGTSETLTYIGPTLSTHVDLTGALPLAANRKPKRCFQGQTPGHDAFVLDPATAILLASGPDAADVIRPFMTGKELNGSGTPERFVIDFSHPTKALAEKAAPAAFDHLKTNVLPHRQAKADKERADNAAVLTSNPKAKVNRHNEQFLDHWWHQAWRRPELLSSIANLDRYIALSRYAVRGRMSIYAFVDTDVRPMDKVVVFAFDDDYSLGVLQSNLHRRWFENRVTLGEAISYTNKTAFDTFPWPQTPSTAEVTAVAQAAAAILRYREDLLAKGITLGEMYDALRTPGKDPLADLHLKLDEAVVQAYHFNPKADPVEELLSLNETLAAADAAGTAIRGPGPTGVPGERITDYKIAAPDLIARARRSTMRAVR